ncbi:hypothetical protein BJ742DRAFT_851700 [Cladochytrium replicatum]|nr:hypothetical protein BJ742DRAFT_851700 [Cladochytrium replicatum]
MDRASTELDAAAGADGGDGNPLLSGHAQLSAAYFAQLSAATAAAISQFMTGSSSAAAAAMMRPPNIAMLLSNPSATAALAAAAAASFPYTGQPFRPSVFPFWPAAPVGLPIPTQQQMETAGVDETVVHDENQRQIGNSAASQTFVIPPAPLPPPPTPSLAPKTSATKSKRGRPVSSTLSKKSTPQMQTPRPITPRTAVVPQLPESTDVPGLTIHLPGGQQSKHIGNKSIPELNQKAQNRAPTDVMGTVSNLDMNDPKRTVLDNPAAVPDLTSDPNSLVAAVAALFPGINLSEPNSLQQIAATLGGTLTLSDQSSPNVSAMALMSAMLQQQQQQNPTPQQPTQQDLNQQQQANQQNEPQQQYLEQERQQQANQQNETQQQHLEQETRQQQQQQRNPVLPALLPKPSRTEMYVLPTSGSISESPPQVSTRAPPIQLNAFGNPELGMSNTKNRSILPKPTSANSTTNSFPNLQRLSHNLPLSHPPSVNVTPVTTPISATTGSAIADVPTTTSSNTLDFDVFTSNVSILDEAFKKAGNELQRPAIDSQNGSISGSGEHPAGGSPANVLLRAPDIDTLSTSKPKEHESNFLTDVSTTPRDDRPKRKRDASTQAEDLDFEIERKKRAKSSDVSSGVQTTSQQNASSSSVSHDEPALAQTITDRWRSAVHRMICNILNVMALTPGTNSQIHHSLLLAILDVVPRPYLTALASSAWSAEGTGPPPALMHPCPVRGCTRMDSDEGSARAHLIGAHGIREAMPALQGDGLFDCERVRVATGSTKMWEVVGVQNPCESGEVSVQSVEVRKEASQPTQSRKDDDVSERDRSTTRVDAESDSATSEAPAATSGDSKRFTCPYDTCAMKPPFPSRARLLAHIEASHKNEKIYTCTHPGCDKSFGRKASLAKHVLIHGEKKWACPDHSCRRLFYRRDNMLAHYKAHGKLDALALAASVVADLNARDAEGEERGATGMDNREEGVG